MSPRPEGWHWLISSAGSGCVEAHACDGFIVRTAYSPGMAEFAPLVIPELRRRDLVRSGYEGRTLRDHLYLARPQRNAWRERLTQSQSD